MLYHIELLPLKYLHSTCGLVSANPPFHARVEGDSMIDAGIYHDDILIIDKAKEAKHQNVVVAWINGEFTVKTYYIDPRLGKLFLVPRNDKYPPYEVTPEMDFTIWGVVTYNIHKL